MFVFCVYSNVGEVSAVVVFICCCAVDVFTCFCAFARLHFLVRWCFGKLSVRTVHPQIVHSIGLLFCSLIFSLLS